MSRKTRRTMGARVRVSTHSGYTIYATTTSNALELFKHRYPQHPDPKPQDIFVAYGKPFFWNNDAQKDLAEWQVLDAAGKTEQAKEQNTWLTILKVAL